MRETALPCPVAADDASDASILANGPALGQGRQPRILLLFGPRDDGVDAMLRGIAQHQRQHGGWCVLAEERPQDEAGLRARLAHGWDGVITGRATAALAKVCAELGIPLVVLDEDGAALAGVARVRPDNAAIGAMGAEWLLDRGFRSLVFAGRVSCRRSRQRQAGFVEAVELGGGEAVFIDLAVGGEWTSEREERNRQELAQRLRALPKPLGVMGCDDRHAIRVLEAAHVAGCQVPEEVAVLGADNDVVLCELATPPLSSVDPGLVEAGYRAAGHLAGLIAGRVGAVCDLRVDPSGVVGRRSTDVLAIPDRAVAAAVRHIAQHACEGLTVTAVLPHAGASRAQLEKKFRRHLGRSPQAEIRRVQIAEIRRLLVETELPLKRIAALTGFAHTEYLCVVFRRLTGETPGAYRRRRHLGAGSTQSGADA